MAHNFVQSSMDKLLFKCQIVKIKLTVAARLEASFGQGVCVWLEYGRSNYYFLI